MPVRIRNTIIHTEDLFEEEGRVLDTPWRIAVVAAVIENPWYGTDPDTDLSAGLEIGEELGVHLAEALCAALGGPDRVQAYGKSAVVGLGGEVEHTSAIIHTPRFGKGARSVIGSSGLIYSTNSRGPAGAVITVPITHRDDDALRDYYMSFDIVPAESPAPDEIVVVLAGATGPRPFARLGSRASDQAAMDQEALAVAAGSPALEGVSE
ncbi:amino acid synthesis family protein [Streptomyces shenzhenensis]|uniref:amino acid synthesis family protein n=1 Tax=Streptomyces shenzhenensis TaxID=943815 RepID=UPI00367BCCEC